MSFQINQLNYSAILAEADLQAFQDALSRSLATNFPNLLIQLGVTMGLPVVPDATQPALTHVPLTAAYPDNPQPEYIEYLRMDLGNYLNCCMRYVTQANVTDSTALAAWLLSEHGLWFDPTLITLSSITQDPTRADRQLITVTVGATNYVWVGQATLYVVADTHLALLAYPGVAKGLLWSDVNIPPAS